MTALDCPGMSGLLCSASRPDQSGTGAGGGQNGESCGSAGAGWLQSGLVGVGLSGRGRL